jgi:hypothetical protein
MDKIKFLIIVLLGVFSLIYNLLRAGISDFSDGTILVFLEGQIDSGSKESLVGVLFDYLIRFAFNVNLNDLKTFFKIFGV